MDSARDNTSSAFDTDMKSTFSLTASSISFKSETFSSGIRTVLIPFLYAAIVFSFNPPIGNTLPVKVTSPVIAISALTGIPVRAETTAVVIAIPAEGPSLGTAPSGK